MDEARLVEAGEHVIDAPAFRRELVTWGRQHFRVLPWRQTEDPYAILMAEVMLHRTQARQVLPVYTYFIERYPDFESLTRASGEQLRSDLVSLGLHWRIDLIQSMAAEIMHRFDGQVPREKEGLLSLPGVSEYIASAVRCFAWNLPEPLVDTNTVRVVGRLFGLEIKDSSRRNRRFRETTAALVDMEHPRTYNYALLDLAHLICHKRRAPECASCPLQTYCVYGTGQLQNQSR